MAAPKWKETQTHTASAQSRKGEVVARPPRPVEGQVNYDELIKDFMKQYPKTRAYLAK
jgi:hypothetical protein